MKTNSFRDRLVEEVKAVGEYINEHAEELVDKADLKTDFSFFYSYDQMNVPTISITQDHAIPRAVEARIEKEEDSDEKQTNGV